MTEVVDLTNCDREPIHLPGSVQPHGAMLVCDPTTFRITFASANLLEITGCEPGAALGAELATILGADAAHDVRNAAAKTGGSEIAGVVLGVRLHGRTTPVNLVIHHHLGRAFVEIEPSTDGGDSARDALDTTQTLIRRISLESDIAGITTTGARLLRAMLGYDRVMIYQFLHNGAGKVIAEAKQPRLQSFLGQHFPASDIPYQARRLYLANTIRMIADVSYAPIPLLPPLRAAEAPVDMSFAQLRSVSPVHCEYLQNMGVFASMSISIVVDGELWGLISCHHDSPKVVPMPLRIGAELFGQYFSLQVSIAERRAQTLASTKARERLDRIVADLSLNGTLAEDLRDHLGAFGALIESDGVALWTEGQWSALGSTPPIEAMPPLLTAIAAAADNSGIWRTQELRAFGDDFAQDGAIAGMLAIPLSAAPRDYLFFFRAEEAHKIEWAGEPVKRVVSTPQGERLTPRGSFQTWREDVKGRSKPWTAAELAVADAIRTYLRDVVLRHSEASADERQRNEQRRRILNDELNHRVKNIITLVKSIALQTGAHAGSVAEYSASLEGRLQALAFAHDQSLGRVGNGDLLALIEAEASLHRIGAAPDRITTAGPGVRLDDQTFSVLALVVHEMMTNAAKYGALSSPEGRLAVSWAFSDDGFALTWSESGGPAVSPPSREGFGTQLINMTIAYDLGGVARVDYAPAGVQARFVIPASHALRVEDSVQVPVAAPAPRETLAGLSVLVVEDQSLIAMDIEETLRALGVADVALASTTESALELLPLVRPDVVILDFNLRGATSEAVADILLRDGVPFLFATGYGDSVMIPPRFGEVGVVRKPVSSAQLAAAIQAARGPLRS